MANTYTYDSYGNLTASSGSVPNPLSYTGRELDTETGLYYYRARYYDATGGRFVSEDPINFSAGVNFYRYVGNKAISLRDPTGKDPVIGATVGTVLGAVYFWDFLARGNLSGFHLSKSPGSQCNVAHSRFKTSAL